MTATADFRRRSAFAPMAGDIIAPDSIAPVRHFRPVLSGGGIIDAEYEEIAAGHEAAGVAFMTPPERPMPRYDTGTGRVNLFGRSLRLTTRAPRRSGVFGFAASTGVLCLVSFWLCGGHAALTRLLAPSPRPEGLAIADVSTRLGLVDGMTVATVDGTVRNDAPERRPVPAIAISTSADGMPSVRVHTVVAVLDPGQSTGFRARLALPEGADPAVSVAFED